MNHVVVQCTNTTCRSVDSLTSGNLAGLVETKIGMLPPMLLLLLWLWSVAVLAAILKMPTTLPGGAFCMRGLISNNSMDFAPA